VEYWNANRAGLVDVCKELGVKGTFDGPPDHHQEQQANIMDRIIARKPAPEGEEAMLGSLRRAGVFGLVGFALAVVFAVIILLRG
jgi:hypothetical protein